MDHVDAKNLSSAKWGRGKVESRDAKDERLCNQLRRERQERSSRLGGEMEGFVLGGRGRKAGERRTGRVELRHSLSHLIKHLPKFFMTPLCTDHADFIAVA